MASLDLVATAMDSPNLDSDAMDALDLVSAAMSSLNPGSLAMDAAEPLPPAEYSPDAPSSTSLALDYGCFPHIFRQIVVDCDFGTQLKLRLLSTHAKAEVDRAHCVYVALFDRTPAWRRAFVALREAPGGSFTWRRSCAPYLNYGLPVGGRVKHLRSRSIRFDQPEGATAFAVQSARVIALQDASLGKWVTEVLRAMRPDATLSLNHTGCRRRPRTVILPPVRSLQVICGNARHTCKKVAVHSARFVELILDAGEASPHCPFMLSLVKPCVEHFALKCANLTAVSTFLEGLQGPFHPQLRFDILVASITRGQIDGFAQFRAKWPQFHDLRLDFCEIVPE